jgi:hypothetical protein
MVHEPSPEIMAHIFTILRGWLFMVGFGQFPEYHQEFFMGFLMGRQVGIMVPIHHLLFIPKVDFRIPFQGNEGFLCLFGLAEAARNMELVHVTHQLLMLAVHGGNSYRKPWFPLKQRQN